MLRSPVAEGRHWISRDIFGFIQVKTRLKHIFQLPYPAHQNPFLQPCHRIGYQAGDRIAAGVGRRDCRISLGSHIERVRIGEE